jgi:Uncharacterised nucleotidyltransferase
VSCFAIRASWGSTLTPDLTKWTTSLAPETRLLLACARSTLTLPARARLTALQAAPLDWNVVLDEAVRHGMIPLLHQHAAELEPPIWAAHRLEREFAATARRSLSLTAELLHVIGALRSAGVSGTPFKGPVLAVAAYGTVVLRQFDNLDLLVHRADVPGAEDVLRRRGYHASQVSPHARAWTRGDVTLVLHCGLAPRWLGTRAGVAGLWVRRRPVDLGEARVTAPGPEDHLVLVTLHAAQRLWSRLGWLADVAALLERNPGLDHFAVRYEARRHGIERLVRLGLGLAQALVDAPLPREVAAWVRRDRRLDDLVRDVCARRLRPAAGPPGLLESTRFQLRSRERWSDRVRYAARGAGTVLALPARLAAHATSGLRERSRRGAPVIATSPR